VRTAVLLLALLGMTCAFSQSWVGLNYAAGTGECELDASPRDGITDGWGAFWSGQAGDSWQARGYPVEPLVQQKDAREICSANHD
jgi:hypothetical protein